MNECPHTPSCAERCLPCSEECHSDFWLEATVIGRSGLSLDEITDRLEAFAASIGGEVKTGTRVDRTCPQCQGAGEVQVGLVQDGFGNWDTEYFACPNCEKVA